MLRYHTGISRDANDNLLPQAFVHAYLPGTQTYIAAFSDELGTTPIQLPLKSDARSQLRLLHARADHRPALRLPQLAYPQRLQCARAGATDALRHECR